MTPLANIERPGELELLRVVIILLFVVKVPRSVSARSVSDFRFSSVATRNIFDLNNGGTKF